MSSESLQSKILGCRSLPTLPVVALRLLEMTRDPDCPLEEISRVVKADQGIASRILRTINSSYYGLSTPCGTIERALGLLGIKTVTSLALGFSLVSATRGIGADSGLDLRSFWTRAIYGAAGARQTAIECGYADPDEAFTGGLFQDIGMLAIVTGAPEHYGAALAAAGEDHEMLPEVERQLLELDHAGVGAELGEKWKLPAPLVGAIRHHHEPERAGEEVRELVRIVWVGRRLATLIAGCVGGEGALEAVEAKSRAWFGIGGERLLGMFSPIVRDAKALSSHFERDIGEEPDLVSLLAEANERLTSRQIEASLEASRLREESLTDGLTGVGNRRSFDVELERAWSEGLEAGTPLAMLFFDADRFKQLNDTHGHRAGDAVLVELARRAKSVVGSEGRVFRYGGEEFAVLMAGADEARARETGERLRRAVAEEVFDLTEVEAAPDGVRVTVSVGAVSERPAPGGEPEGMVHRADECVYSAKQAGRNRVCAPGDPGCRAAGSGTGRSCAGEGTCARPARVLLVEDDALSAKLLEMLLRKGAGAEVVWLRDGRSAMERVERISGGGAEAPDVVIADLNLPDMDGVALVEAVRRAPSLAGVPVLVVSAAGDEGTRARSLRAGATEFAAKGDIAQNVSDWVRRIARMRRAAA